jgi:hypothetical protein
MKHIDEVFRPIFFIPNVMKKKNYKLHFLKNQSLSQKTITTQLCDFTSPGTPYPWGTCPITINSD